MKDGDFDVRTTIKTINKLALWNIVMMRNSNGQ